MRILLFTLLSVAIGVVLSACSAGTGTMPNTIRAVSAFGDIYGSVDWQTESLPQDNSVDFAVFKLPNTTSPVYQFQADQGSWMEETRFVDGDYWIVGTRTGYNVVWDGNETGDFVILDGDMIPVPANFVVTDT